MVALQDKQHTTSIDLNFATVTLRNDGIIHTDVKIKDAVSLNQAKELLDAYLKVGAGKKLPHLFTVSKFVIMEKEVMEFITQTANQYGKADAFVIHSLPQRIIGNFYLQFHKPSVPTKLFTSQVNAIIWLKTFL